MSTVATSQVVMRPAITPATYKVQGCVFDCSIQALLSAPNPDDPLAENIASEWKKDEAKAMRTGAIASFQPCMQR